MAAVVGLTLAGLARDAHAALRITATQGGVVLLDVSDNDGPVGADTNANFGVITLGTAGAEIPVGTLFVSGSTHVSNANYAVPSTGLPLDDFTFSRIQSGSLSARNPLGGATATHIVTIEDSNDASPFSPGGGNGNGTGFGPNSFNVYDILTSSGGEFVTDPGGVIGSSITVEYFADANNNQRPFNAAGALASPTGTLLRTFTFTQTQAQQSLTVPTLSIPFDAGPDTQFGMALRFTLTLTSGTRLNVRSQTSTATPVPEPATLAMACAGLPLIGIATIRRRRKARA